MDITPERGYPYPECEPPLVKDSSDIAQLRDLAVAVDEDMQGLYDLASDLIVHPDACRMFSSVFEASTSQALTIPFFNSFSFDNTAGGAMSDTANGVIQILEPGRYIVGSWTHVVSTTHMAARVRYLRDGIPVTQFSPHAQLVTTDDQYLMSETTILFPGAHELTLEIRTGAVFGTPFTYASRIWAVQVQKL